MEKNISENSCFHDDKSLWPILRRIIECDKPQETIYGGPRALVTISADFKRAFFLETLRGCSKHKLSKKRQPVQ